MSDRINGMAIHLTPRQLDRLAAAGWAPAESALGEWMVSRIEAAAYAEAERDRLARTLAVERGDQSQAPEGWQWREFGRWIHPLTRVDLCVVRRTHPHRPVEYLHGISSHRDDGRDHRSEATYPTALEAMEAADAAMDGAE